MVQPLNYAAICKFYFLFAEATLDSVCILHSFCFPGSAFTMFAKYILGNILLSALLVGRLVLRYENNAFGVQDAEA